MKLLFLPFLALGVLAQTRDSENVGTNIAESLQECYHSPINVRDMRLPTTMNVLIEIIRKIEEDQPTTNNRVLSLLLLHRFRQDGIIMTKRPEDIDETVALPYAPVGKEAPKGRLQMQSLTPLVAFNFNNNSINLQERCSLHHMISSTIERRRRGDENNVCDRVARYTNRMTHRIKRREVELVEQGTELSECPVESGVVATPWGAVKAGLLISGIAAGLQPTSVPVDGQTAKIDNRFASTIGGVLSELSLYQPKLSGQIIGNHGQFNSSTVPKYYFLDSADPPKLYVTDAGIRGGIDGLLMALNVNNNYKDSKVSQILDLYYSRGMRINNNLIRACDRIAQFNAISNITEALKREVEIFDYLLYNHITNPITIMKTSFKPLSDVTVKTLTDYIKNQLSEIPCSPDEQVERASTHVVFFIDTAWPFETLQQLISYLLDNLDVNKYESSYTILNGQDGSIIVNDTNSILDGLESYNRTIHQTAPSGFDYTKVLQKIEEHFRLRLDNETSSVVAQSTIALLIPHTVPQENENNLYNNRKNNVFRNVLPDLRILVVGTGSKDSYNQLVTNTNNDIFTIQDFYGNNDESLRTTLTDVVQKIRKIPRNIVNPRCRRNVKMEAQDFTIVQFVEPNGVLYSKISPQYYKDGNNLRIRGEGYGTLEVCYSKDDVNPRSNSTGTTCQTIDSNELVVNIHDYCSGNVEECQPIYISAKGVTTTNRCRDKMCRFPDSIKYNVIVERGRCPNGAGPILINLVLIVTLLSTIFYI